MPNADKAIVDFLSVTEYLPSLKHPDDRHKERLFKGALEIGPEGAKELQAALLTVVKECGAECGKFDRYGRHRDDH